MELVGGDRVGNLKLKSNYLHSPPRQYRLQQFGSTCVHQESKPPGGPHRWKSSGRCQPRQPHALCMAHKDCSLLGKWHTIAQTHNLRFRASFRDLDHSVQPCRMEQGCIGQYHCRITRALTFWAHEHSSYRRRKSLHSSISLDHHGCHFPAGDHGHISDCRVYSNLFRSCISTRLFEWFQNLTGVQNKINWRDECLQKEKLRHKRTVILCAHRFVMSLITWDNTIRPVQLSVVLFYSFNDVDFVIVTPFFVEAASLLLLVVAFHLMCAKLQGLMCDQQKVDEVVHQ